MRGPRSKIQRPAAAFLIIDFLYNLYYNYYKGKGEKEMKDLKIFTNNIEQGAKEQFSNMEYRV